MCHIRIVFLFGGTQDRPLSCIASGGGNRSDGFGGEFEGAMATGGSWSLERPPVPREPQPHDPCLDNHEINRYQAFGAGPHLEFRTALPRRQSE